MRIIKLCVKSLLALFLVFLIFWTIAFGMLQIPQVRRVALNHAKEYVEKATDTQIEIKKVSFSFPLSLNFENLTLSQQNLPLVSLEHLDISCSYMHLLQGRLVFSQLYASGILLHPLGEQFSSREPSASWDSPLLPFYLKFAHIDLKGIHLAPSLIDSFGLEPQLAEIVRDATFNLKGMISNNPFRKYLTAHLQIKAISALPHLKIGIDAQKNQLSLSCQMKKMPLQLLQPDLPSSLKGDIALAASAPVVAWQDFFQNKDLQKQKIEGQFKVLLEPSTILAPLFEDQTSLISRFCLKSSRKFELLDLKIDNPNFVVRSKDVVLTPSMEIEKANFYGILKNLARFNALTSRNLQGKLSFQIMAKGSLSDPSLTINLESPQISIDQQLFQNVRSKIQTDLDRGGLKGLFTLSFDHQNLPFKMAADFARNELNSFALSNLEMEALDSKLTGHLACSYPEWIWEGSLEAQTKNLQSISQFFSFPLSGESTLKVKLAEETDAQNHKLQGLQAEWKGSHLAGRDWQADLLHLNLRNDPLNGINEVQSDLHAEELRWQNAFVGKCNVHSKHHIDFSKREITHTAADWKAQEIRSKTGLIQQAEGHSLIQSNFEGKHQFFLRDLQTETIHFEEIAGKTTIQSEQTLWPFELTGKGLWKEDLLFAINGKWHTEENGFTILAEQLSGRYGPYPLELLEPLHLQKDPTLIDLSGMHVRWGEAEIQGAFKIEGDQVAAQFNTNAVPSELFHFISPDIPLSGRATFKGHLEGSIHHPEGQFRVDLHNIQIIEEVFAQKPFMAGQVLLDLNEKGVQIESGLTGIGQTPLLISGTLPLILDLDPFQFKTDPSLSYNLLINAEGELDPFLHLFYNDSTNLSGHAKIALILNGQMTAPQIKGSIDLQDGSFESLNTGAIYHNIQAHLEGDGSNILLTHFSAEDTRSGSITATGSINLDPTQEFPFKFEIQPSQIYLLDSDYVSISASGKVNLTGNSKKSKLQGELAVDQAIIRLEEALPGQIKSVDVTYINIPEDEEIPLYADAREPGSSVELDVILQTKENVIIQGNHLKSEWKGSLAVNGTLDKPQLNGDLRVASGEYDLNGKVFTLNQGTIHFAGSVDKKTTLYVVASKELDRIRAEIIVKGSVKKPEISFRSNPPLSQREVLSNILFNRGISDITPDQGDQLSQSFISLNSSEQTKQSVDFLSRLRNNMGIDRLDFTTMDKENKDFGLHVGKYITENVIVSVNQGMTSLSPVIAVEAKLRKNFKLQAEAGVVQDAPVKMSLKWKKDY